MREEDFEWETEDYSISLDSGSFTAERKQVGILKNDLIDDLPMKKTSNSVYTYNIRPHNVNSFDKMLQERSGRIAEIIRNNMANYVPTTKGSTMYSFNVVSEIQIDFEEIAEDLTKQDPFLFIEHEGHENFLLVHRSLATKAEWVNMDIYTKAFYTHSGHLVIHCPEKQTARQWVKHFDKVKKAQWPEKKKGKVTVSKMGV